MPLKKIDVVNAASDLRDRAKQLSDAADALWDKARKQSGTEIPDNVLGDERNEVLIEHGTLETDWVALAQALNVSLEGTSTDFAEFLTTTGAALVATQRQLDTQSKAYLDSLAGSPHVLPSVFRIPKLSGEMKFALERVAGQKLNLVFYGKEEKNTALNQQSMSFEIVSAPPPPEFMQKLLTVAPRLELVLALPERERIMAVVQASDLEPKLLPQADMLEHPDEVLITPAVVPGEERASKYFLLYANETQEELIGAWHVDVAAAEIVTVYRYDLKPGSKETIKPFKDFTLALAKFQAAYLRQLRPPGNA